jgi:hypothetical protein
MCGEGITFVTRSACRRRDFYEAELGHAFYACPWTNRNFSLQTALFEPLLETRSKTNRFLLVVRFQNASPMHVGSRLGVADNGDAVQSARFHGGILASLSRSAHLRNPLALYCFTDQLVTGKWRPQSCFFCCFGVRDLCNSWRRKESSPPE